MQELTTAEFNRIRDFIKANYGITLSDEKKTLVYSRLRTTLTEQGFSNFSDYFDHLIRDKSGESIVRFVDKITTNHTFFMRESDHFDYLRDTVFPYISETYGHQRDLRLWCCASSSGEEPVTLQMLAQDHFKKSGDKWDTQILATDISTNVLDKAVYGRYATEGVNSLPKSWQTDYFKKVDHQFSETLPIIRQNIIYRTFNLMNPIPFTKKFQVIFCRNVMIYFDAGVREQVVKKLYDATETGGYLFIGHSESLNNTNTAYKYIKPAIYRK
ncbi:MAG: protein-glutamate O-methyltransferase CheR [Defluviitaleaceae bacterium]|nr:protein-glutamate O-methyltransferase CheR [Defluviitaleaceae bacterium]MCL2275971.1 protein-glutamate O-methyltransferase CheR [Defluviitaleaceae bacterium]